MYPILLSLHSLFRWFVLLSLLLAIGVAAFGYIKKSAFSKSVNHLRHWTATISHIQLVIGMLLYTQSPFVSYFYDTYKSGNLNTEALFFGVIHIILMFIAILFISIGSAKAKRQTDDTQKYRTMLTWFTLGLVLIFIAIPWPFSPLASRPLLRPF
ncbi:hypothetical protein [Flavobacterium cerinum]|uniref:Cytochrome B n=1 Tax=Flavobacterium cerinum TaxID=2502784 RepID=A0ABY5INP5_9FLAO|nr:hypothetical protein [Flavobacterium cerinum]UUC43835.1 hypothetical protein NOX80_09340 [Flavobacterium cerinum]